jgi:hypothetical protein
MTTDKHASLPGEQRLELKRGQTLFWNGNMIHRGRAPEDLAERMSIVAHMERHRDGDGPAPVDECFRWMLADNVRPALPEKMLVPYDRWYRLQQA